MKKNTKNKPVLFFKLFLYFKIKKRGIISIIWIKFPLSTFQNPYL